MRNFAKLSPLCLTLAATMLSATGCKTSIDEKPAAKVEEAKADESAKKDAKAEAPEKDEKAAAKALKADKSAGTVAFVGAKVTGEHRGFFRDFEGKAELAGDQLTKLELTVQTGSIEVDPKEMDEEMRGKLAGHLKDADFFDVAKFPKASFASTAIKAKAGADGATHEVTGDLEIRGIKKSVTFPATITVEGGKAKSKAAFKIDRKLFGIEYAGMKDDLIKDEVALEIELTLS